mgnify:CR=1 FL=1
MDFLNLKNNKNLFLLFLSLACVSGIGAFFVPSVLALIIYYYNNKKELKIECSGLTKLKKSFLFMAIFLFGLLLSWLFVGETAGIKLIRHNVERMLPFIFIIFGLAGKNDIKEKLKYILIGCCIGIWIDCLSVLEKIFIDGLLRPVSLLGSVNILGGTLILILPFLIIFAMYSYNKKYIFTFTTVTGALLLFTLLIIKSRGSWFGLGIMVALLPILLYKINKISFKLLLVIESLLLIIAIGTYFVFYEALHRGYDFVRPGLRIVAWNIFLDYPIAGIGPSNFISNYTNENFINPLANVKGVWTHAHNIYFKFLSENGIFGFSGFIALIIFQLKVLWKSIIEKHNKISIAMFLSICGMLAHGWFDVCFSSRYYAMTYWLLWGIVYYIIINETKEVTD